MKQKKTIIIALLVIVIVTTATVVFIVPLIQGRGIDLAGADYRVKEILYDTNLSRTVENEPYFRITNENGLYVDNDHNGNWEYIGELETYPLTTLELKDYTLYKAGWVGRYNHRSIADACILRVENQFFYLAFKTAYGEIFLGYGWEDVSERGQRGSDDTSLSWLFRLTGCTHIKDISNPASEPVVLSTELPIFTTPLLMHQGLSNSAGLRL